MKYGTSTVCIHGNGTRKKTDNTGSISFPIYQTASFAHPGVGQSTGYDYSRAQNPTREEVERIMADLEHGVAALAFSSGMAAVSAFMELFAPGTHIIATDDLYGGTIRQFRLINEKNGIRVSYVDTSDLAQIESVLCENTKLIYLETPTNPMMQVTDIAAVSEIAKKSGALLAVDNTFLTPYFQNPLDLGADIVIHSATKYLEGHNDTLGGFLVTNREDIAERLRAISKTTGAVLAPFDSWLILRGIKTLAVRMEKHQENALAIAGWLKTQAKVKEVRYIGLDEHPGREITERQSRGYSSMLTFRVDSKETVYKILENVRVIQFAESLGGAESLITYPMMQTHADVPEEVRRARGIDETLLRMSVGIEDVQDLIADLQQAFEA
ncbi:MAG: PLP-dependent aspartate aminotransferase family protein [Roseburia sp.]|nr:PLP-dependent aspartate aminotransferase family protein [Ruminococcus sp.]MCM1156415.1 PLP-dependent aspartate aminotransferase family protein [Roseburia sp.]MCM1242225.1 PLP-dependent aspartate aminotransferase family protein [Roseburia sp.]